MRNLFVSENLKYRRSFEQKLILIAPMFFILYAVISKIYLPAGMKNEWRTLVSMIYNWWTFLFLPLGIALISMLTIKREVRSGTFRALSMHSVSRRSLWLVKNLVLAGYLLLSCVLMVLMTILVGLITASGIPPLGEIVRAAFAGWLASLGLIPLQLAAAYALGGPAGMTIGIGGTLAGVMIASGRFWYLCPWSYALRLMCPMTGTHPNGVGLIPGDPLLDPGVILPGILLSLLLFGLFAFLGAVWFAKREVK